VPDDEPPLGRDDLDDGRGRDAPQLAMPRAHLERRRLERVAVREDALDRPVGVTLQREADTVG
jgi:hypothetical protein